MVSKEIADLLPQVRSCLNSQPVTKAWLFGSCSRGEESKESDVDILVRYDENARITLSTIVRLSLALKGVFNREVDVVEEGCLLPLAVPSVSKDQILIYERGPNKNPLGMSSL